MRAILKSTNVTPKGIFSNNMNESEGNNSCLQKIDDNCGNEKLLAICSMVAQMSNFRDEQLSKKHGIATNRIRINTSTSLEVKFQNEIDPKQEGQADVRARGYLSLETGKKSGNRAILRGSDAKSLRSTDYFDHILNQGPKVIIGDDKKSNVNADTTILRHIEKLETEMVFNRVFNVKDYLDFGNKFKNEAKTVWVESHFLDQVGGNNSSNHYDFYAISSISSNSHHASFEDLQDGWYSAWEQDAEKHKISNDLMYVFNNFEKFEINPKNIYISGKIVRDNPSLHSLSEKGFNVFESPRESLGKAFDDAIQILGL